MMLLIGLLTVVLLAVLTAGNTGKGMAEVAAFSGNEEMAGEFRFGGCLLALLVGVVGLLMVGAIAVIGGG